MERTKELTIVVPVFNASLQIKRLLDSIVPQLKEEYELLLIDDGSTDDSLTIAREYEAKYTCIRVIEKENEGIAKTRNLGIEKATGEYICFVDDDDFLDPNYFSTFLSAIKSREADIVLGGYHRMGEHGVLFTQKPCNSTWYRYILTSPWAKIYRTGFLLKCGARFWDYPQGEDIVFNLQCYRHTSRIAVIAYTGYYWFYNGDSVSNTRQKEYGKNIDIETILDAYHDMFKDNMEEHHIFFLTRYAIWYLLFSCRGEGKDSFDEAFQRINNWFENNRIPFFFPCFSKRVKGERVKNRIIIFVVLAAKKMHCMRLLSFLWA